MLNFPARHWLFNRTLAKIEAGGKVKGRFFNDFGPWFVSLQALAGEPGLDRPYSMRMLRMDEGGPLTIPSTPATLERFLTSSKPFPFIHLDFDKGDMHVHSSSTRCFVFSWRKLASEPPAGMPVSWSTGRCGRLTNVCNGRPTYRPCVSVSSTRSR